MKIQATGRRTVSIRLSGEELSGYGLTFAELEPGNRRMEQMMGELLSRVYEETGMDLFDHTLRMKAMPMETGCELTLSGLMARRGRLQNAGPAAVDFLEWKSLCRGAEALLSQGAFRKSSVFQMRNGWRPVSYTHLDVYKRQEQREPEMQCCQGRLRRVPGILPVRLQDLLHRSQPEVRARGEIRQADFRAIRGRTVCKTHRCARSFCAGCLGLSLIHI